MAVNINYDKTVASLTFSGPLTANELITTKNKAYNSDAFWECSGHLWDFLATDATPLDEAAVEEAFALDSAASLSRPNVKVALVADNTRTISLCLMY